MVKAKVVAVEEGKVKLQAEGWDKPRTFKYRGQIRLRLRSHVQLRQHQPETGKMPLRHGDESG